MINKKLEQYTSHIEGIWNESPECLAGYSCKEIRLEMDISQIEAAALCNIDLEEYRDWELGRCKPSLQDIKPLVFAKAYFDFFTIHAAIKSIEVAKSSGIDFIPVHSFNSDSEFAHYEPAMYERLKSSNLHRRVCFKICRAINSYSPDELLTFFGGDSAECGNLPSIILEMRETAAAKGASKLAYHLHIGTDEYELYCAANMINIDCESRYEWVSLSLQSLLGDHDAEKILTSGRTSKYLH